MFGNVRCSGSICAALAALAATASVEAQGSYTHIPTIWTGQQAPGTPDGVTFGSGNPPLGPPYIGNGRNLVIANLTGTGVTTTNDIGLWPFTQAGVLEYLARDGDVAPGTGGAIFDQSANGGTFNIGANGTFAFRGTLVLGGSVTAANNTGVWAGTNPNNIIPILRTGDVAAGTGGATFATLGVPEVVPDGRVGQFNTLVQGGAVTAANDLGFWITTPGGSSSLFWREGDTAPGTG